MINEKTILTIILLLIVVLAIAEDKTSNSVIYLSNKTGLAVEYQLTWSSSNADHKAPFHHMSFPAGTEIIDLYYPAGRHITIPIYNATLIATASYQLKQPQQVCITTDQTEDCLLTRQRTAQVSIFPLQPATVYTFTLEDLIDKDHPQEFGYKKLVFHTNSI
ncbi:MAG TPA: hypothetical protein VHA52_12630 [Candidatus Babeliaceae bacterium]|nr:hypothetical protein [Candidatus Babeliaceae bacterium]